MYTLRKKLGLVTGCDSPPCEQDFTGEIVIIPFEFDVMPAASEYIMSTVTPQRIVDEVVFIFIQAMGENARAKIRHGPDFYHYRIYSDVIIDEVCNMTILSTKQVDNVISTYEEYISDFYRKMVDGLLYCLDRYGLYSVERLRFREMLSDAIVLEIGDEEESTSASLGYGGIFAGHCHR